MYSILQPSPSTLDAILRDQRDETFSYVDVGATRTAFPDGYRHLRRAVELGRGERVFLQGSEGLRRWQAHLGSGVVLRPTDTGLEKDLTVVLTVPVGPLYTTFACRIVYVVDEPTGFGFAYGTLPHHVIEGEEAFLVERDAADSVRFRISAFTRPRGRLMRAVTPVVQLLDERLVRRYLRALQRYVAEQT